MYPQQELLKFVTIVGLRIYTNTGSLLALSLTSVLSLVPSSELIHSPAERESDIDAPADWLPTPI